MKSWLRKFKTSAALDEGKPLPERLRKTIAASEECRRFEQSARELDSALRASRPAPEAPAFLHDSIMHAVEAASRPAPAPLRLPLLRWLPAPALALLLVAGWALLHRPAPQPQQAAAASRSLALVATAVEVGNQMPRALPVAVVSPLSDELERVGLDVDHTTQFLLANVP
jgi:hypothetical protein